MRGLIDTCFKIIWEIWVDLAPVLSFSRLTVFCASSRASDSHGSSWYLSVLFHKYFSEKTDFIYFDLGWMLHLNLQSLLHVGCVRFQGKMSAFNCTLTWFPVVCPGDLANTASEALFRMLKLLYARMAELCHKSNFRIICGHAFSFPSKYCG